MRFSPPPSAVPPARSWSMWTLVVSFYFFQFFFRASPNALSDTLMREFQITALSLGWFSAAYLWAYSCLQIPVGILLDYWGPKRIVLLGISLCTSGVFLFASAKSFWVAVLARALIGAGASGAFIGTVRTSSLWFTPKTLAFVIAMTSSVGIAAGTMAHLFLLDFLGLFAQWRSGIYLLGCLGFVIALMIFVWMKDTPHGDFISPREPLSVRFVVREIREVFHRRVIWFSGFFGCIMYFPVTILSETWASPFLQQLYHISPTRASKMSAFVTIGTWVGGPIAAFLSDRFHTRVKILQSWTFIATVLCSIMVFFPPQTPLWGKVLLFCVGFFSACQVLAFAVAADSVPRRLAGTTAGSVNMMTMAGAAILAPVMGFILDFLWKGAVSASGIPIYALSDFQWAFSTVCISMALAFLWTLRIRETYPA